MLHGATGAGQAWVRPADHADEADERGAVRIRRSERATGKPLQDHPWSAAPHRECVGARFRETDDDSRDARQNASEQACRRERSGRDLITDGRHKNLRSVVKEQADES